MPALALYLIRHARAAERGARHRDDAERPLLSEGEAQARIIAEALVRLGVRLERLASSPLLRARQTAEPLRALGGGELTLEGALAQGDPHETARALRELSVGSRSGPVAAVGHEPYLSRLAAHLLCGSPSCLSAIFPPAAVMVLTGELRAGGMALSGFWPEHALRTLLASGD